VAHGWQAAVTTLTSLRSIVHALRGWPTPLGSAVNSAEVRFEGERECSNETVAGNLRIIGRQVAEFALGQHE
jgi:FMN reductase